MKALIRRMRNAIRAKLALWIFADTPMIWIKRDGVEQNVPVRDVEYCGVEWHEDEHQRWIVEIYRDPVTREVVRQSAHIQLKEGLSLFGEQGRVS